MKSPKEVSGTKVRSGNRLPLSFYRRDTVTVAKELLGKRLVRIDSFGSRLEGTIVEVEAYLGAGDPACHTWNGRKTERVKSMYRAGGCSYVYFVYGMHHCFNVVTRGKNEPEAVLIRALAPEGELKLKKARLNGPAKICKALQIDRKLDGYPLGGKILFIEYGEFNLVEEEIGASPRIGVDYSGEAARWPLRFFWRGSLHLSKKE